MEKELCFKFLEHLYKYSSGILKKEYISDSDVIYINNEVDNFLKRLKPEETAKFDKTDALSKIEKIKEETGAGKAKNISKTLLKSKFHLLGLIWGSKDDGHIERYEKVAVFNDRIKKIIIVMDLAQ